jgi:DmsE family decaheme c-type cytochrome
MNRAAAAMMRVMAHTGSAAALVLVLFASAAAQTPSDYVGSNVCRTCHADIWLNFYKNPHFKSVASGAELPERTGCEGCHGPGKAHVGERGGKNTIPHAFSLMKPGETLEVCLSCHAKDQNRANIRSSEHTLSGVACTRCHSIHRSAAKHLLAKTEREVCFTCHAAQRAQFEMPSRHRVDEGFMQCSDCHNPHGGFPPTWRAGQSPRLMTQAAGNKEPCIQCHADKFGPFVFEHPSVAVEGCEACHNPHGSMNAKLLKRPVVFTLCLQCHNGGGSGTRGQGVDIQSPRHNLLDPKFQKCTACHVRIHGSDADPYFLR